VKRAFAWMAAGSCRRPYLAIALVLSLTVALGAGIPRLRMEFTQRTMLPRDYPSVRAMEKVEEEFGGAEYAKVLVEGDDLTGAGNALALYRFERDLREGRDNDFHGDFLVRLESYVSNLTRNPQADLLFSLCLALREGSREEATGLVSKALADPAVADYRDDPRAAPLLSAAERLVSGGLDDASWEALKGQTLFLLERGVEEAVRQYLSSPGGEMVLGRTLSPDHGYALVNVQVNPALDQEKKYGRAEEFRRYAEGFFASRGLKASVSGEVYIMKVFRERAMRDSALLGLVAFFFIVLVLFLTFRRVLDVVLTLLVVALSNLWVFGLMGLVGIRYTMMSVAIVPLLLGIDIAYSIHVLTRYYEERDKRSGALESAVTSVSTVGIAVFLAAATTMFGFLSFSISDMPPMRDFGWMCLVGVFFGFLLSITLLPAALVIRDERRERLEATRKESNKLIDWLDRGLAKLSLLAERHRALTWAGTVTLVVVFALLATGLSTSADFRTFVPQDLPEYVTFLRIEEVFGAQDTALVVLEGRDMLSPASLEMMETLVREAVEDPRNRAEGGGYKYLDPSRTNSLPGILALAGTGSPGSAAQAEEELARLERDFGFEASSLVSPDRDRALVVFQVPFVDEKGEKEMAAILQDKAAEIQRRYGVRAEATGTPLIVSDAIGRLFSTQLRTGGLALLLCALLVTLIFRSLAYGLMATSVVFLAIVLELGLLRLIGWPLDIMTVMIASMVIGTGIDFGIHVAHRFREELEKGVEPEEGINATVRSVGAALIPGALTTAGAFLILAFSSLSPLKRFGVITALALVGACFAAMVIEPTFLATYGVARRRWVKTRGRGEGSHLSS